MYLFYWGGGDEWGGCVQLPSEEKHNSSTWPKGLALRQQSQTLYSKQICYVSDCQIREFYSFPSGWFQLFAKGWFGDNMERVKTFFWTRKSHHIIIIFLHKKWRHAFAGRDSLCHRLYHLRPVNLVCQVAFRQAAAFRKHRLNLWASRTRPAGQWRRALNACSGGGGVGGVVQYFLETLVLTTSQRLRS